MTNADALTILEDAHRRCDLEDMRTADVFAALTYLQGQAERLTTTPETWPFDQFRHALGAPEQPFSLDHAGRGQVVNASLNGMCRVCGLDRQAARSVPR